VAFASSLDQIGPMTKNIKDSVDLLSIIGRYDQRDSTSYNKEQFTFTDPYKNGIKGLKIGLPKEYFSEGIDNEVKKATFDAVDFFKKKGLKS